MTEILKIIAPILAIIGVGIWIERRFNTIERKFITLENQISSIVAFLIIVAEEIVNLEIVSNLSKGKIIGSLEMLEKTFKISIDKSLSNPLTREELRRIQFYREKIRKREDFTPEEAQDFYALAEKVRKEKPSDSGALILAGIAGFILGLFLGSKK